MEQSEQPLQLGQHLCREKLRNLLLRDVVMDAPAGQYPEAHQEGVELGVGGELEDVADDGAVGGVEAGAAGAPKGLQDVLYRVLGARAGQQREVLVPPERRRR